MQCGGFPRMKCACNAGMPVACTVNGEDGFFLKVGRLESKVLTLKYLV